jgi:hypothetical protein
MTLERTFRRKSDAAVRADGRLLLPPEAGSSTLSGCQLTPVVRPVSKSANGQTEHSGMGPATNQPHALRWSLVTWIYVQTDHRAVDDEARCLEHVAQTT